MMMGFWKIFFGAAWHKSNRDGYGWWRVQACLTIMIWLQTLYIVLLIIEPFCK